MFGHDTKSYYTMRPISYSRIKKAIPGSGGIILRVMNKAGYKSWLSVRDFIQANPDLAEMMRAEEEILDDFAENNIGNEINQGNIDVSKWWLARRRRQKYGDSVDITTKGESIQIVKVGIDIDKL